MHSRELFVRVFLIALAVQVVFYVFFHLWGTDSSSHGLNTFGDVYLWIYFVPPIPQMTDSLGPQNGLRGVNAVIDLSPPIVALIYSVIFAAGVLFFRRVRQTS
jgi:hypothetical protein